MAQTPATWDDYVGDGVEDTYQVTFPYQKEQEVFAYVDEVPATFTFISEGWIQFTVVPANGAAIRIQRSTEAFEPRHEFSSGVPLLPRFIDENNNQFLYVVQEAVNETSGTASEALSVAEEARDIAQEASDKVDAAVIDSSFQLRQDLLNTADPSKNAELVGWVRTPLADGISTVGAMLNAQWVNIWEYAALAVQVNPSDISTWDWQPAIQAAVNDLPQVLYFPPITGGGVYYTESPVVVNGPVVLMGTHPKRGNTAGGTRIENRGSGDCITYSDTAVIYDAGIKYLGLTATTGGSPLRIRYGAVRCHFTQLYLYSKATNRPCVSADYSVGTLGVDFAGMFSCVFDGGEYIVDNVARTAGIIDLFANATVINENEFKNIWLTQANGRAAIRLFCTVNGPLLTNNRFQGLTFEICSGGLLHMQGTSHTKISGVSAWDTPAGYTGSLILVSGDVTKTQNRGLLIENFARVGNDPLNGAAVDIDLGFSRDTTIINHSPNAGLGAIINAASRTCVIVGAANATVNNDAATTYVSGAALSTVAATIRGTLAHTGTQAGFFGHTPVNQPTALPNTSGASLVQIEGELNTLKQKLRDLGLLAT